MDVLAVPVLHDNISYVVIDRASGRFALVDPVDPDAVLDACRRRFGAAAACRPDAVWTTHKHADHAGGNDRLADLFPGIAILGGRPDRVPACTTPLDDGDEFALGAIRVRALLTPCHTRGHVLLYCTAGDDRCLFTGDTLFVAGCGRFFEGTATEMQRALNEVVAALPRATNVYCGHEYTVANLEFAAMVEPLNPAVGERLAWARQQRARGLLTVPSTIERELATNPFMRVDQAAVRRFANRQDPVGVMDQLRAAKNAL